MNKITLSEYFHWNDHPFADTSSSFKPYLTEHDSEFLQVLPEILNNGKNIVVAGNAGAGKTFLMQNLISSLDKRCFKPVFIKHGYRTRFSFWKALAHELRIDISKPSQNHMLLIHEHLIDMTQGKTRLFPVLVIDDFHRFSHESMLDACTLLTNPDMGTCGASLILCGDETLPVKLQLNTMAPVRTRITYWHFIQPLANSQVSEFIKSRLVNAKVDTDLIERDAIEIINSICHGNKREIMNFCFNMLNEAMVRREKTIGSQLVLTSDYYKQISG